MKLEDQVCSLELAKKLKELGVPQESYFVWYTNGDSAHLLDCPDGMKPMEQKTYSAYTVAELGEMLPWRIAKEGISYYQHYWSDKANGWTYLEYLMPRNKKHQAMLHYEESKKEANARAQMLVYLIENGLINK